MASRYYQEMQESFRNNSKSREFPAHSAKVHSVAWSCDGRRLASGSFDKTASVFVLEKDRLVSLANMLMLAAPHTHSGRNEWMRVAVVGFFCNAVNRIKVTDKASCEIPRTQGSCSQFPAIFYRHKEACCGQSLFSNYYSARDL